MDLLDVFQLIKKDSRGIEYDDFYPHLSNPDTGVVFQVLIYDQSGKPVDWDEFATIAARDQYFAEHPV